MISIDNPHFTDGWEAYHRHLPRQANPFLYLANPHRLWSMGYDCAHMCELAAMGSHLMPGDLHRADGEPALQRLDKSPFAQGQVAYAKRLAISECPYDAGTNDNFDWRCGWQWEANKKPVYSDFAPERHVVQPVERGAWLAALLLWWRGLWS